MNFENPSSKEQPKSLLDSLKEDIAAAEGDLKGHYKKDGGGDGYDTYKEGKEKSTDLLAMRKAAKTLEASEGDVAAAIKQLQEQLEEGGVANDDVYTRAVTILERKSQAN